MPHNDALGQHKPKIAIALILTFSSGMVDIVGYAGIYRLFTAHVTGTTVHFGRSLVLGNRIDVIAALAIVAAFFLGSVAGRAIIEAAARRKFRRIATITLAIEAGMLAIVAIAKTSPAPEAMQPGNVYLFLALLAAAMGMQTATLTGIGPLTVHTTFVTGMINKLGQLVSRILFRAYDFLRGRERSPQRVAEQRAESRQAAFLLGIWACYVLGAAGGTAAFLKFGMRTLFLAIIGMAIAISTDLVKPLSIEEEREQSER